MDSRRAVIWLGGLYVSSKKPNGLTDRKEEALSLGILLLGKGVSFGERGKKSPYARGKEKAIHLRTKNQEIN